MASDAAALSGPHGRPGLIALWLQAIRVRTLVVMPPAAIVGSVFALAQGYWSWPRFIMAVIGTAAIQSGTNLINDYYDYESCADPHEAAMPDPFGPSLCIQRGLLTPAQIWWGGIGALGLGSILGLVLTALCGWPILLIGVASVAAAYFYTARPVSFAYIALGDLVGFIFMGPAIVLGAYYVQALSVSWGAVAASISIGFLGAGILLANNVRDIDSDPVHGKRTIASLLGRRGAILEVVAFDAAAYAATLAGVIAGVIPPICLIVFLTLPRAIDEIRILTGERDWNRLNLALKRSAQLHLEFCLLLIASLLVVAFV
ncbi:MAG: 1,4-dihydroxy-2-naphthoate octaprenyltransferase [Candidatus Binataceae bacterium]